MTLSIFAKREIAHEKDQFILISGILTNNSEGVLAWENEKYAVVLQGHVMLEGSKDDLMQVAECFQKNHIRITEMLQGLYIVVIYDKSSSMLSVFQDKTTSPATLYYTVADDILFLSTSLKVLLEESKIKRSLNEASIEDFVVNGYIYGKQTLIDRVYKIEPFCALVASKRGVEQIKVRYSVSNMTQNQALASFKETLDQAIVAASSDDEEISLSLSSGFDSSYIALVSSTQTNKMIHAFSVGGKTGKNEIPAVEKNISYFQRTSLNLTMTTADTLKHLSEIVERLEGSVFEIGIFLQYELLKKVSQCGVTSLICGECADQVFNPYFFNRERIFPENCTVMKYTFSEYPFIVGTQMILKKSGIMANSFGIETKYPYLSDEVVNNSMSLGSLNGKNKRCHVKNCMKFLPPAVLMNIAKIGGATNGLSLFDSRKEIVAFFRQVEATEFYRKHKAVIKRHRFLKKTKPTKNAPLKSWIDYENLLAVYTFTPDRTSKEKFVTERKIEEYLKIMYIVAFEKIFVKNV